MGGRYHRPEQVQPVNHNSVLWCHPNHPAVFARYSLQVAASAQSAKLWEGHAPAALLPMSPIVLTQGKPKRDPISSEELWV